MIPFGKFPTAIVEDDFWRDLTKSERAIYPVIVGYSDGRDFTCRGFTLSKIAYKADLSTRTAQRAIDGLVRRGLISEKVSCGRGRTNEYTINPNPDTLVVTFSGSDVGTLDPQNPDKPAAKTSQTPTKKVTKRPPKPDSHGVTPSEGQSIQNNRGPDVGEPDVDERAMILAGYGVVGAVVPDLLRRPGVTVDRIRSVWQNCNRLGVANPQGLLVSRLREPDPKRSGLRTSRPQQPSYVDQRVTEAGWERDLVQHIAQAFSADAAHGVVQATEGSFLDYLTLASVGRRRGELPIRQFVRRLVGDIQRRLRLVEAADIDWARRQFGWLSSAGQLPAALLDVSVKEIAAP